MVVVVVATLQRALHVCMGQKKTGMLITFSDLYQKCLRKPWKFLLFFFPRPPCLKFAQVLCAAHRRSLLQQEAAEDTVHEAVLVESCAHGQLISVGDRC